MAGGAWIENNSQGLPGIPIPFNPSPFFTASFEGSENGVPSFRAVEHWLHFTVKMRGNARDRFFSAAAPGLGKLTPNVGQQSPDVLFQENPDVLHSAWAEVAYFLFPTGTTINPRVRPGTCRRASNTLEDPSQDLLVCMVKWIEGAIC
jgi:hypothetical protein